MKSSEPAPRSGTSWPPFAQRTRRPKIAIYGLTDCDADMKYYGREVARIIAVLRAALKDLCLLREDDRIKN